MDEEKRFCGLNYARNLNFTEAQYEEALKRVDKPDPNQLLDALLDVSSRDLATSTKGPESGSRSIRDNYNQNNNINQVQTFEQPNLASNSPVMTTNCCNQPSIKAQTTMTTVMTTPVASDSFSNLSSTSCYSSITSFPSSSDQSLESPAHGNNLNHYQQRSLLSLSQPVTSQLKKVYIDGSNVARTHGKNVDFSWKGIKLCVDWFLNRQHEVVKVLVPEDKCQHADEIFISYLEKVDALIRTPSGCNDDFFIIEAARQNNGVIVSNDLYRDETRSNEELEIFIKHNRLSYIFVEDLFIATIDPRGRFEPLLDKFLCEKPANQGGYQKHNKLSRTKSHQLYQRNGLSSKQNNQYSPGNGNDRSYRSLHSTKSLPLDESSNRFTTQLDRLKLSNNEVTIREHSYNESQHLQVNYRDDDRSTTGQFRKSKSIAYGNNNSVSTKEVNNHFQQSQPTMGRKSALMRTKSHNI